MGCVAQSSASSVGSTPQSGYGAGGGGLPGTNSWLRTSSSCSAGGVSTSFLSISLSLRPWREALSWQLFLVRPSSGVTRSTRHTGCATDRHGVPGTVLVLRPCFKGAVWKGWLVFPQRICLRSRNSDTILEHLHVFGNDAVVDDHIPAFQDDQRRNVKCGTRVN